jgi:hypothetical protein
LNPKALVGEEGCQVILCLSPLELTLETGLMIHSILDCGFAWDDFPFSSNTSAEPKVEGSLPEIGKSQKSSYVYLLTIEEPITSIANLLSLK